MQEIKLWCYKVESPLFIIFLWPQVFYSFWQFYVFYYSKCKRSFWSLKERLIEVFCCHPVLSQSFFHIFVFRCKSLFYCPKFVFCLTCTQRHRVSNKEVELLMEVCPGGQSLWRWEGCLNAALSVFSCIEAPTIQLHSISFGFLLSCLSHGFFHRDLYFCFYYEMQWFLKVGKKISILDCYNNFSGLYISLHFSLLPFLKSYLFTGVNSYKVRTSSFGTCTSRNRSCVK